MTDYRIRPARDADHGAIAGGQINRRQRVVLVVDHQQAVAGVIDDEVLRAVEGRSRADRTRGRGQRIARDGRRRFRNEIPKHEIVCGYIAFPAN